MNCVGVIGFGVEVPEGDLDGGLVMFYFSNGYANNVRRLIFFCCC